MAAQQHFTTVLSRFPELADASRNDLEEWQCEAALSTFETFLQRRIDRSEAHRVLAECSDILDKAKRLAGVFAGKTVLIPGVHVRDDLRVIEQPTEMLGMDDYEVQFHESTRDVYNALLSVKRT